MDLYSGGEVGAQHMSSYIRYTLLGADSRFAPSQWETALLRNDVSHWLGANQEPALPLFDWPSRYNKICDLTRHFTSIGLCQTDVKLPSSCHIEDQSVSFQLFWVMTSGLFYWVSEVKVFHPKQRLYQNELILCTMKLRVFCDIVPKGDENVVFSQF